MSKSQGTINIHALVTWFYGLFCPSLAIWIVYLWCNLPIMHESIHWRAMWVVFDVLLLSQGVLSFYFLLKKSPWASLPLVALAALFVADVWFDVMTSITQDERMAALFIGVFTELPLAVLSLGYAVYMLRRALRPKQNI